jgi:hypothetical protein
MEERGDRAPRGFGQITGVPGRQDVDPFGAELDRVDDRRVVGDASVDQQPPVELDRGKDAGDRGARDDRLQCVSTRQAKLAPAEQVGGDDVKRDRRVLESSELEVFGNELSQRSVGDQVITGSEEAEKASQRVERENVPPADRAPDCTKLIRRVGRRRTGGNVGPLSAPTEVPTIRSGATPRS